MSNLPPNAAADEVVAVVPRPADLPVWPADGLFLDVPELEQGPLSEEEESLLEIYLAGQDPPVSKKQ